MACRTGFIIAILAALLAAPTARAQGAGDPAGIWSTQAGDARVRVSKCGGGICGVIVGLREIFARHKIAAVVQGFGPMFQIYFTERNGIHDYRDFCAHVDAARYSRFIHRLLDRGIYMTPSNGLHWIITTAHTEADVAQLLAAADAACSEKL